MRRAQRVEVLLAELPGLYPDARCLLEYGGRPERLLVATILSAQTTDAAVNSVTPELWKRWPDLEALASAERAEVEDVVHPLGFFRSKARSIQRTAEAVVSLHDGRVPATMEELVELPGVGRKTANVVLGEAFGQPAIVVDTHVKRLSGRLDLTRRERPDRIEEDLRRLIPPDRQTSFSHRLGFHGRSTCTARRPDCEGCAFAEICPRRGVGQV
jgi:endonuclease-3